MLIFLFRFFPLMQYENVLGLQGKYFQIVHLGQNVSLALDLVIKSCRNPLSMQFQIYSIIQVRRTKVFTIYLLIVRMRKNHKIV